MKQKFTVDTLPKSKPPSDEHSRYMEMLEYNFSSADTLKKNINKNK